MRKLALKRWELFEFEDYSRLPTSIRTGVTHLIRVFHQLSGTKELLVELLLDCKQQKDFNQIIDLGSGSGGPMMEVLQELNQRIPKGEAIQLLLSDKFPNPKTVARINSLELPNVKYAVNPVDALELDRAPEGLKTMIASFHHMRPQKAQQILHSAQKNKEPFLIYEMAENNIPVLLWWLLLPVSFAVLFLMALVLTLWVRPLTFNQLLFTFLIPVIPIIYAWDGQASLMRTYTFSDIKKLIGDEKAGGYVWSMSKATKKNGKSGGYYVFGYSQN